MASNIEEDFKFYLKFAKPLIVNLDRSKDRILTSAWVAKLKDAQSGTLELRLAYLKLLLFVLQRKKIVGPFADNPNITDKLEPFPQNFDLQSMAKAILEVECQEKKELFQKRLRGEIGDFPPFSTDYSADLLEYVSAQDIPNFGVHAYYAIGKRPLPDWENAEKGIFPKSARHAMDPSGTIQGTLMEEPSEDSEGEAEEPPESPAKKIDLSPEIKAAKEKKRTMFGIAPPVLPMGEVIKEEEVERERPSWGSNLLEIKQTEAEVIESEKAESEKSIPSPSPRQRSPMTATSPLRSPRSPLETSRDRVEEELELRQYDVQVDDIMREFEEMERKMEEELKAAEQEAEDEVEEAGTGYVPNADIEHALQELKDISAEFNSFEERLRIMEAEAVADLEEEEIRVGVRPPKPKDTTKVKHVETEDKNMSVTTVTEKPKPKGKGLASGKGVKKGAAATAKTPAGKAAAAKTPAAKTPGKPAMKTPSKIGRLSGILGPGGKPSGIPAPGGAKAAGKGLKPPGASITAGAASRTARPSGLLKPGFSKLPVAERQAVGSPEAMDLAELSFEDMEAVAEAIAEREAGEALLARLEAMLVETQNAYGIQPSEEGEPSLSPRQPSPRQPSPARAVSPLRAATPVAPANLSSPWIRSPEVSIDEWKEMEAMQKIQEIYEEEGVGDTSQAHSPFLFSKYPRVREAAKDVQYRPEEFGVYNRERFRDATYYFQKYGQEPPSPFVDPRLIERERHKNMSPGSKRFAEMAARMEDYLENSPAIAADVPVTTPKPLASPRRPEGKQSIWDEEPDLYQSPPPLKDPFFVKQLMERRQQREEKLKLATEFSDWPAPADSAVPLSEFYRIIDEQDAKTQAALFEMKRDQIKMDPVTVQLMKERDERRARRQQPKSPVAGPSSRISPVAGPSSRISPVAGPSSRISPRVSPVRSPVRTPGQAPPSVGGTPTYTPGLDFEPFRFEGYSPAKWDYDSFSEYKRISPDWKAKNLKQIHEMVTQPLAPLPRMREGLIIDRSGFMNESEPGFDEADAAAATPPWEPAWLGDRTQTPPAYVPFKIVTPQPSPGLFEEQMPAYVSPGMEEEMAAYISPTRPPSPYAEPPRQPGIDPAKLAKMYSSPIPDLAQHWDPVVLPQFSPVQPSPPPYVVPPQRKQQTLYEYLADALSPDKRSVLPPLPPPQYPEDMMGGHIEFDAAPLQPMQPGQNIMDMPLQGVGMTIDSPMRPTQQVYGFDSPVIRGPSPYKPYQINWDIEVPPLVLPPRPGARSPDRFIDSGDIEDLMAEADAAGAGPIEPEWITQIREGEEEAGRIQELEQFLRISPERLSPEVIQAVLEESVVSPELQARLRFHMLPKDRKRWPKMPRPHPFDQILPILQASPAGTPPPRPPSPGSPEFVSPDFMDRLRELGSPEYNERTRLTVADELSPIRQGVLFDRQLNIDLGPEVPGQPMEGIPAYVRLPSKLREQQRAAAARRAGIARSPTAMEKVQSMVERSWMPELAGHGQITSPQRQQAFEAVVAQTGRGGWLDFEEAPGDLMQDARNLQVQMAAEQQLAELYSPPPLRAASPRVPTPRQPSPLPMAFMDIQPEDLGMEAMPELIRSPAYPPTTVKGISPTKLQKLASPIPDLTKHWVPVQMPTFSPSPVGPPSIPRRASYTPTGRPRSPAQQLMAVPVNRRLDFDERPDLPPLPAAMYPDEMFGEIIGFPQQIEQPPPVMTLLDTSIEEPMYVSPMRAPATLYGYDSPGRIKRPSPFKKYVPVPGRMEQRAMAATSPMGEQLLMDEVMQLSAGLSPQQQQQVVWQGPQGFVEPDWLQGAQAAASPRRSPAFDLMAQSPGGLLAESPMSAYLSPSAESPYYSERGSPAMYPGSPSSPVDVSPELKQRIQQYYYHLDRKRWPRMDRPDLITGLDIIQDSPRTPATPMRPPSSSDSISPDFIQSIMEHEYVGEPGRAPKITLRDELSPIRQGIEFQRAPIIDFSSPQRTSPVMVPPAVYMAQPGGAASMAEMGEELRRRAEMMFGPGVIPPPRSPQQSPQVEPMLTEEGDEILAENVTVEEYEEEQDESYDAIPEDQLNFGWMDNLEDEWVGVDEIAEWQYED